MPITPGGAVRVFALAAAIGVLAGTGAVASLSHARPASPGYARQLSQGRAESAEVHYAPLVQSRGYTTTLAAARTAGMEGFGYSTLDLKSWSDAANAVRVRLRPAYEAEVQLSRSLAPRGADRIALKSEPDVRRGRYAAAIAGSDLVGVVARTEWVAGVAAAYEAPEISTRLLVPLTVRDVYSHTSILYFQNVDESGADNKVDVEMFDNASGEISVSFTTYVESGTTVSYDTWFDDLTFGDMPINAGDGGSILAMRIAAEKPLAAIVFGDEMAGNATSAYVARPQSAAAVQQYLPSIRANYLGTSLIALANPSLSKAVDATITYRPHDVSADEPGIEQPLRIEARGAAYIDLANLNRGLPRPAGMPFGSRPNQGFHGHAVIRASSPLLAVAQEEARVGDTVRSLSAYNGFGPADLDTSLAVPRVHNGAGGRKTMLVLMNPGDAHAAAVLAYTALDGSPVASVNVAIPAGGSKEVVPLAGLPELSQLDIVSDRPLAVVACETTLLVPSDWGKWGLDALTYQAIRSSELLGPTPPPPSPTPPEPSSTPTRSSATATRTPRTPTAAPPTASRTPTAESPRFVILMPYAVRR